MRVPLLFLAGWMLAPVTAAPAVSGRVLGRDGTPLAGVTVSAYAHENEQQQSSRHADGRMRPAIASVSTAADGSFRIPTAPPFAVIEAKADGYLPASDRAREDTSVTLILTAGRLARGVVTASGKAVAGALVVWKGDDSEVITRTAADGSFEAPEPESQRGAWLLVLHPEFAPKESYLAAPLRLDQRLDTGTSISGTVVDAEGRPVAAASLWIDSRRPAGKSDAQGAFRVLHAPNEWTNITARTDRLVGAASRRTGPLAIRLGPRRVLWGTVREAKTLQPLAAVLVGARSTDGIGASAFTDARGQYTLDDLPPGAYQAWAQSPGFSPPHQSWSPDNGIDLRHATSAQHDLTLTRLPRVLGRVEDGDHKPVDGALVTLGFKGTPHVYAGSFGLFDMNEGSDTIVRTGAAGTFSLVLPEPEQEANPFAKDRPLIVMKHGYAAGRAEVPKPGANARPVVITLTRGVELTGRVTSADGAPVAGVAVTLAEGGTFGDTTLPMHVLLANSDHAEGWATSDAVGRFSVRVHPAIHDLWLRKPGFALELVRDHDPRTGTLEVVLDPAAVVRGRIVRNDGRGVEGVEVTLSRESNQASGSGVSAADGSFEIGDLAPGVYGLTAAHTEMGMLDTRTIEAPALDVRITLGPAATLRGRVVDAASHQPVPKFQVTAQSTDGARPSYRKLDVDDPAGAFAAAEVPVGEVSVSVHAEGYIGRVDSVTVTADGDLPELEIALQPDAPIRGEVTSDAGPALPEVGISVKAKDGAGSTSAGTDGEGRYEVRGLAPGDMILTFQARGFATETRTLDTRQTNRLDVVMKRGLSLRGEVVADGAGVPQAAVSANSSARGAALQYTTTDDRGRFTLQGLEPARYTVSARARDGRRTEVEDVNVETAVPLRLVLDRKPTAILTGRVVGLPQGDEAGMAMVMATSEEDVSSGAFVDRTRTFRMDDAPAGRVTVRGQVQSPNGVERSSRPLELTLAPGSETEVVVEFASEIVITGLLTRDGGPVPYATVNFSADHDGSISARADARGAYEIVGVDPGRHDVQVTTNQSGQSGFATDYVVIGSAQFDIDMTDATVTGRAVRSDTGLPVAGVEVSLFRTDGGENRAASTATTNAQGAFAARSLRGGRYRLITSKAGFGQEMRDLEVASGSEAEVLLELSPADGVSVTVVDARDGRAMDAIVVVRDAAKRIVANKHSGVGENGVLNIPLANGSYLLSTSANGYGTATLPVTAPTEGLRVPLTPGGTLVIESPRDLRGRIRLIQPDGEEYVRCWCNGIADIQLKGRRTTVENVTPGPYMVELADAPEDVTPKPVLVLEGQKSTVTIE